MLHLFILKYVRRTYRLPSSQHSPSFNVGWDCHGLPIELKALQGLKGGAGSLSPLEIRKSARECAAKAVESQMKDFCRWGVLADWGDIKVPNNSKAKTASANKDTVYTYTSF